jgi:hypothetical protein
MESTFGFTPKRFGINIRDYDRSVLTDRRSLTCLLLNVDYLVRSEFS